MKVNLAEKKAKRKIFKFIKIGREHFQVIFVC